MFFEKGQSLELEISEYYCAHRALNFRNIMNFFYRLSIYKVLIISSLLFVACTTESDSKSDSTSPNILLIVADDLGYTDLGCFGGEIRTPHLDALAAQGIRNTAFYTAPTCSPTRAMLLSGVDNHRNGYGTMEGDWAENQLGVRGYEGHLNFDVVTFPKLLQDQGYHTSIAGKWHQAYPATNQDLWPEKRGFNRSFNMVQGGAGHFSDQQRLFSFFDKTIYIENGKEIDSLPKSFYSSDFYTQKAIEYIDESRVLNKPFFTFLSFTAPHWPLQIPDDDIDLYKGRYDEGYEALSKERLQRTIELGIIPKNTNLPPISPNVLPWNELSEPNKKKSSRIMEIYAAMVERMDRNIGVLIDHLKSTDQYNNTLIIFMSDNGAEGNSIWGVADTREWVANNFDNSFENLGRENSYIFTGPSWAQVSSLPFRWYKGFSTEGGVRTPSIISFPKWSQRKGSINDQYVSVMDLAPTILEMANIEHPETTYNGRSIFAMDGTSLFSWLSGVGNYPHAQDKAHCWELYGRRAVLKGKWKAEWQDAPYGNDAWELYNLEEDLTQLNNLADSNPKKMEEMIAHFQAYSKKYNLTLPNEKVAYGSDDIWRE